MIEALDLTPSDQVLLLDVTDLELVAAVARQVTDGLVVGLGEPDFVFLARRATRELDNVMFHSTTPDEIPFRDGFFTVVVCGTTGEAGVSREVQRVLAPNGRICMLDPSRRLL
jgi:SAM-dependent methyltransferase